MFMLPFAIIDEGGGLPYVEVEKPRRKKKPELKEGRNGGNLFGRVARSTRDRIRRNREGFIPGSEEWLADRLSSNGDLD